MSTGLIALLDDIAAIAKVAATALDDAAGQAAKAGAKAAGVVVDDAAVTPRYVVGFTADRELPIVWKIALGSLKNKMLFLLPGALLLSSFAPWAILPLLMLGGAFLCYEGAEKAYEALWPHAEKHGTGGILPDEVADPAALEAEKVASAIKTDFILSAEIMAITLSTVSAESLPLWEEALVLAVVAIGITVVVYGAVALIVKADDAGLALARNNYPPAFLTRAVGRGLVLGMPILLTFLSVLGTAAMLWVGGGIIVHGMEGYGLTALGHGINDIATTMRVILPTGGAIAEWFVGALLSGLIGLALGALLIPVVHKGLAPMMARFSRKAS